MVAIYCWLLEREAPRYKDRTGKDPLSLSSVDCKEQFLYWDASWSVEGVQSFSVHTRFIEENKWKYLSQDLPVSRGLALEVGCGSGHFGALLAQAGFTAILLDYSPAALACARNSFLSLKGRERRRFLLGDALALPIADDSVDVVVSCGVLEHFVDPLRPMQEMVRVLRRRGLFYADICPLKFRLIDGLNILYKKPPGWYEKKLGKAQIRHMARAVGLERIRIFGAGVLPPRDIPGTGKLKLKRPEARFIESTRRFWISFDGTRLGELLGLYYYVSGIKPD